MFFSEKPEFTPTILPGTQDRFSLMFQFASLLNGDNKIDEAGLTSEDLDEIIHELEQEVSGEEEGKAVKFMETFEIEMKKALGADIDTLDFGGLRIKFVARKNSLGPSRKSITAELLWWYADDGQGNFRQRTAWDWDTSTVELLLSFENAKGKKTIYNRLKEITGITGAPGRTAYSTILGIPKSDPQLYRIVGGALEQRADLLGQVYQVLGITQRRPFVPGMDYREMLTTAIGEARARTDELYQDVQGLPVVTGLAVDGDVVPEDDSESITSEDPTDEDY